VESITGPITRIISRDGMLGVYNSFSDEGGWLLGGRRHLFTANGSTGGSDGWRYSCMLSPHCRALPWRPHLILPILLPCRQEGF
jgi:hypothetical protein